jgi:hypothetical protein
MKTNLNLYLQITTQKKMIFKKKILFICMFLILISLTFLVNAEIHETEIITTIQNYCNTNDCSNLDLLAVDIIEDINTIKIYIDQGEAYPEELSTFKNIGPIRYSPKDSYIFIDKLNKKIYEAAFLVYSEDTLFIGKSENYLPRRSKVFFKNNRLEIIAPKGSEFKTLPKITDINSLINGIEIQGEEINLPGGTKIINGRATIKSNGILLEEGIIENKGKLFNINSKREKVLIANKPLDNYNGNWIYESEDELIIQSLDDGNPWKMLDNTEPIYRPNKIRFEFIEGNNFIEISEKNKLSISVHDGDSLKILNRNGIPRIIREIGSEYGITSIKDYGTGEFYIDNKEISVISTKNKNKGSFRPTPLKIFTKFYDENENARRSIIDVSSNGEIEYYVEGDKADHISKNNLNYLGSKKLLEKGNPCLTKYYEEKLDLWKGFCKFMKDGTLHKSLYETIDPLDYPTNKKTFVDQFNRYARDITKKELPNSLDDEYFGFAMEQINENDLKYMKRSSYKPTKSEDKNAIYYTNPFIDKEIILKEFFEEDYEKGKTKYGLSGIPYKHDSPPVLDPIEGHTLSMGKDDCGTYLSIYDKYDFGMFLVNSLIPNKFETYDRIYYTGDLDNPSSIKYIDYC